MTNANREQIEAIIEVFDLIAKDFDITYHVEYSHTELNYTANFRKAAEDYLLDDRNCFDSDTYQQIDDEITRVCHYRFKSLSKEDVKFVGEINAKQARKPHISEEMKESDRFTEINDKAREELEDYCLTVLHALLD